MYELSFKNVSEIRMGSPFNIAEVILSGGFVPDLSGYEFQDVGLVDSKGYVVFLVQWSSESNVPQFRVWRISSHDQSVRRTDRFEGCCRKLKLIDGELGIEIFKFDGVEKIETMIIGPSSFEPFEI